MNARQRRVARRKAGWPWVEIVPKPEKLFEHETLWRDRHGNEFVTRLPFYMRHKRHPTTFWRWPWEAVALGKHDLRRVIEAYPRKLVQEFHDRFASMVLRGSGASAESAA